MVPATMVSRFASEKTLSTHDQIARALGSEILRGVHAPGANLPPEPDLLARFAISRTVLREVIKTLAAKGFVVSRTRVGTWVQDPVHWNFFDADVLAWKVSLGMDQRFRRDLAEMRRAVEPKAASLAANRRTREDLAELRRCIAVMAERGHSRRSFAEADLNFHLAVGAASQNPLMRSVAAVIEAALIASFSLSSPVDQPQLQADTVIAHAAIVDAIEAGNGEAAALAMLAVIDDGFERIEAEIAADPAATP